MGSIKWIQLAIGVASSRRCRNTWDPYALIDHNRTAHAPQQFTPTYGYDGWKLDCDSGTSQDSCAIDSQVACDLFCQEMCHTWCAGFFRNQQEMTQCLSKHGLKGCAYHPMVYEHFTAPVCRKLMGEVTHHVRADRSGPETRAYLNSTLYIVTLSEIVPNASLGNFKRVRSADLRIKLSDRTRPPPSDYPPDVANVVRSVDLGRDFDCDRTEFDGRLGNPIPTGNLAHWDIRRTTLFGSPFRLTTPEEPSDPPSPSSVDGAEDGYGHKPKGSFTVLSSVDFSEISVDSTVPSDTITSTSNETPTGTPDIDEGYEYTTDISDFLRFPKLQALGGFPRHLVVYWPGEQPDLLEQRSADVRILTRLPPTTYFSFEGIFSIYPQMIRG